jgi:hypothetical protein
VGLLNGSSQRSAECLARSAWRGRRQSHDGLGPVDVVDISDWAAIQFEAMGRDERKTWIAADPASPRDEWWLWKPCLSTGDGSELRLNDVAEAVTYRLAQSIGLPTAVCHLAVRRGVRGVISRNVSPPTMELSHGSAVVPHGFSYGLAGIKEALAETRAPEPCAGMSGFQVFAGYVGLDAWTANTDRHGENWGVLLADDGSWTLAPAFDHGSALGSGLTDLNRATRDVRHFCHRGRTRHFEGGGTLVNLADEAIRLSGATWWAERIADVPPRTWRTMLEGIEGMSVVARTFMDGILTYNQERVSELCRR